MIVNPNPKARIAYLKGFVTWLKEEGQEKYSKDDIKDIEKEIKELEKNFKC
mgnify:CR=1 FL=1